jgi:hypothetical protein
MNPPYGGPNYNNLINNPTNKTSMAFQAFLNQYHINPMIHQQLYFQYIQFCRTNNLNPNNQNFFNPFYQQIIMVNHPQHQTQPPNNFFNNNIKNNNYNNINNNIYNNNNNNINNNIYSNNNYNINNNINNNNNNNINYNNNNNNINNNDDFYIHDDNNLQENKPKTEGDLYLGNKENKLLNEIRITFNLITRIDSIKLTVSKGLMLPDVIQKLFNAIRVHNSKLNKFAFFYSGNRLNPLSKTAISSIFGPVSQANVIVIEESN